MGSGAQVAWTPMGRLLWSSDSASAPIVVLGVPLDETTSFRPGARFGPTAIREASHALEDYSLRQSRCLEPTCVYDAGDLVLPLGNVQDALDAIKTASRHILENGQNSWRLAGNTFCRGSR